MIEIDDDRWDRYTAAAADREISVAELIAIAVDQLLARESRVDQAHRRHMRQQAQRIREILARPLAPKPRRRPTR